jgi:hypothetical protein
MDKNCFVFLRLPLGPRRANLDAMFEPQLRAAMDVLNASGLGGKAKSVRGPRGNGSITYRLATGQGTIEVSMMFYGTAIHTTAIRVDPLLTSLQESYPLTVEGARSAAINVVARLNRLPMAEAGESARRRHPIRRGRRTRRAATSKAMPIDHFELAVRACGLVAQADLVLWKAKNQAREDALQLLARLSDELATFYYERLVPAMVADDAELKKVEFKLRTRLDAVNDYWKNLSENASQATSAAPALTSGQVGLELLAPRPDPGPDCRFHPSANARVGEPRKPRVHRQRNPERSAR